MQAAPVCQDHKQGRASGLNRRRESSRQFTVLPLTIKADGREHVGLLRDISRGGMFFYTGLTPEVGSEFEVVINASRINRSATAHCRCRVIRVEPHRAGAATGVGVAIAGCGRSEYH